jgi:glutathione peroxidase
VPVLDIPVNTLDGEPTTLRELAKGKALLVVNVASRCGLTPQYAGLEALQRELGPRGFTVVGVPCNQFGGQEPGSPEEISTFCSTSYGVTFPLTEKIDVNGEGRHPLYQELAGTPDAEGTAGDVQWNFEKFVVDPEGAVLGRFRPRTDPHDETLLATIDRAIAASPDAR